MAARQIIINGLAVLSAVQSVRAHSWVEMIRRISSTGAYVGQGGYAMGHANRTDPDFGDADVLIRIESTKSNPPICGSFTGYNNEEYQPVTAAPGEFLALQYRENGHVSFPPNGLRGFRSGNVMIYGTTEPITGGDLGINDVLYQWNANGTSGNQQGKLLAGHFFDDGQCFEAAGSQPSSIRDERIAKYNRKELMCQSTVQIPLDVATPSSYSLIWVWDWPQHPNEAQTTTEIYVSCMTINIDNSSEDIPTTSAAFSIDKDLDVSNAAISSQLENLIEVEQRGTGIAPPPAPTGFPEPEQVSSASTPTNAASSNIPARGAWNSVIVYIGCIHVLRQMARLL